MKFFHATLPGIFLLIVTGLGCGQRLPDEPQLQNTSILYVRDVPFYPQKKYQCGPAALAAVLGYWGDSVTPEEIAEAIYLPRRQGTLSLDLWRYATARGMKAQIGGGSLSDLEARLKENQPVIAFLNLGTRFFPRGHFLVVVGLDLKNKAVIAHSGIEKDKKIPFQKFLAGWEKTNFWTLLVAPGEKPYG